MWGPHVYSPPVMRGILAKHLRRVPAVAPSLRIKLWPTWPFAMAAGYLSELGRTAASSHLAHSHLCPGGPSALDTYLQAELCLQGPCRPPPAPPSCSNFSPLCPLPAPTPLSSRAVLVLAGHLPPCPCSLQALGDQAVAVLHLLRAPESPCPEPLPNTLQVLA